MPGKGYAGRVASERHLFQSLDLATENASPPYSLLIENEGFVSYIGVPLIVKGAGKMGFWKYSIEAH